MPTTVLGKREGTFPVNNQKESAGGLKSTPLGHKVSGLAAISPGFEALRTQEQMKRRLKRLGEDDILWILRDAAESFLKLDLHSLQTSQKVLQKNLNTQASKDKDSSNNNPNKKTLSSYKDALMSSVQKTTYKDILMAGANKGSNTGGQGTSAAGTIAIGHTGYAKTAISADVIVIRHGMSELNAAKNITEAHKHFKYDPHLAEHAAGMRAISGMAAPPTRILFLLLSQVGCFVFLGLGCCVLVVVWKVCVGY